MGQRITGMTSGQKNLFCVGSPFDFAPHGQCGMELSSVLPHLGRIADRICLLRAVHTDPINHDPAVTYLFTGHQQPGRPTLGAWASYGLGSESDSLPAFIVLLSGKGGQSLQTRYWGSGFLPTNPVMTLRSCLATRSSASSARAGWAASGSPARPVSTGSSR